MKNFQLPQVNESVDLFEDKSSASTPDKIVYSTPQLTIHGQLEHVTQQGSDPLGGPGGGDSG